MTETNKAALAPAEKAGPIDPNRRDPEKVMEQYRTLTKSLSCDEQWYLSEALANNLGYELTEDTPHRDCPHERATTPTPPSADVVKARGHADRIRWLLDNQPNALSFANEMVASARSIMESLDALIQSAAPGGGTEGGEA